MEATIDTIGEWTHIDKTAWGPGRWQVEPDKVHWIDPATDMDCLAVRHDRLGHWCGYVGVTEAHPAFGKDSGAVDLEVHGGLTFAGACRESEDPGKGICHVPQPGRPEHVWWLGFDCAHAWDVSPGMTQYGGHRGADDVYRDLLYVKAECESLAAQLKALGSRP